MKRSIIAIITGILTAPAAHAAADLVKVPVACGTLQDIKDLLGVNMPSPETLGKGGNSRGEDLVVLLSSPTTGYWALVATMSPESVCVVASGRNWQALKPGTVKAF
jgi:hypothetical protein